MTYADFLKFCAMAKIPPRLRVNITQAGVKPAAGDTLNLAVPAGWTVTSPTTTIDRGAGPVTLFTGLGPYTLQSGDIPPIGSTWPIVATGTLSAVYSPTFGLSNPIVAPGAPTIGAAFGGAGKFQVNFTLSGNTGGSAILDSTASIYRVSDNVKVAEGTGTSPIIVTNVPAGQYYAKVASRNVAGTGAQSASSNIQTTVPANTYMVASNRFALPIDWGTNDTNFANGSDPRAGGNGTSLYLFARRRLIFTTGSWAAEAGKWLWSNASNTVNGMIEGLFPITFQRVEVRLLSDLSLVDVVKFGGSGSVTVPPGGKIRNDPIVTLAPNTTYTLDIWDNSPAHSSFPVGRPLYLAGESSSESMTDQSALPMPASGFGNALLGYVEPSDFLALGWDGSVCVEIYGDSIADGTQVSVPLATARGDIGHVTGACGASSGGSWNYHTTAKASSSFFATYLDGLNGTSGVNLIDWYADANVQTLGQTLPAFSLAWCEHGRNNASSTVTLAQMQSYFNLFADKLLSRYPSMQNKIVQQTTTPVVTNTANYYGTSLATQTATGSNADPGNNGILRQWNNWIIAGCGGRAKGIDTASAVRDGTEYAKWAVPVFSALTTAATTANTSNVIQLDTAPALGTTLVIEAGDATNADANNTARTYGVVLVTPNGGNFDCSLNARQWGYALPPGQSFASRVAKAHAIGVPVVATGSQDGLHPASSGSQAMMNYNIAQKPGIITYLTQ